MKKNHSCLLRSYQLVVTRHSIGKCNAIHFGSMQGAHKSTYDTIIHIRH